MESLFQVQPFRAFREFKELTKENREIYKEAQKKTVVLVLKIIENNIITKKIFINYLDFLKKLYVINIYINEKLEVSLSIFSKPILKELINYNLDLYKMCNFVIDALNENNEKKYEEFADMINDYDLSVLISRIAKSYKTENIREMIMNLDANEIFNIVKKVINDKQILAFIQKTREKLEEIEKIIIKEENS